MSYYIYDNHEEPKGPYSLDELLTMWRAGSISSEAFYCEEGYKEWLPLRELAKSDQASIPPAATAQTTSPEKRSRKLIILTVSAAALAIPMIALLSSSNRNEPQAGMPSSEYTKLTNLRAVGAINQLPLAPTQTNADNYEMEYNVYDIPERVKSAESFPTAPFRATVKILEGGTSSSKIEVQGTSEQLVGWVPNDWLENSDQPIKRRESEADKIAKQEANQFLGMSAAQLQEKLGPPIRIVPLSDAYGSDLEQIIYDETGDKETFFLLQGGGAEVIDGEYRGVKLTPKYR